MQETKNGREHERLTINVVAEVSSDTYRGSKFQVADLSKTGAYLVKNDDSGEFPEVGMRVNLKLVWPMDTGTPPLEVEADVMRVADDGMGVQFKY